MRTAVISDLHVGAEHGGDLVRRERFRGLALDGLAGAERVVLLGDVIEFRDLPVAEALEAARPFFDALDRAADGAEVVLVPGNHDHHLLDSWAERRRLRGARAALGLEHRARPTAGPAAALARMMTRSRLELAYPGVWLREGVYATHGHYLDLHLTIPTFERLGVAAVERLLGGLPVNGRSPGDYERVEAPLYAFLYNLAQSAPAGERALRPHASARAWDVLRGSGGRLAPVRAMLLGSIVFPGAVRVANRFGLGPFRSDLSVEEVSRAGVRAMEEVVQSLGIEAEHLIFGHTHRRGPLPGEERWTAAGGVRLYNCGNWVYAPGILGRTARESPFWPGTVAIVEDTGPPRLEHLLDELTHADFREG